MAVRTTEIIVRPFFYLENHHVHVIKHRSPNGYRDYWDTNKSILSSREFWYTCYQAHIPKQPSKSLRYSKSDPIISKVTMYRYMYTIRYRILNISCESPEMLLAWTYHLKSYYFYAIKQRHLGCYTNHWDTTRIILASQELGWIFYWSQISE
jgi:hypothetical protein